MANYYKDDELLYTSGGSSQGVGVFTAEQQAIKDQMNANSKAWKDADAAGRSVLEEANKRLAAQLGAGVTFDAESGKWTGLADQPKTTTPTFDYSAYQATQPVYNSNYSQNIDNMLNELLNRDAFSYNAAEDALYQQYKTQYEREGNRSMQDTLAAAASQAGGMNSYAVTAAQQANDYYAAQLTDKIPELYQLAYQMYLDDIDLQVQDLGILQQMDDTQYGRYRDTMSDWRDDRDFAYNMYRDQVADSQWDQSFNTSNNQWQQEFDYGVGQNSQSNAKAEVDAILAAGGTPSSSLISASGYTPEYIAAVQAQVANKSSGSGKPVVEQSERYSDIRKKALAFGTSAEAQSYLESMVDAGYITEEEAYDIYMVDLGGNVEETPTVPSGIDVSSVATYDDAVKLLKKYGNSATPLTIDQWNATKTNEPDKNGKVQTQFATYADYLKAFANYHLNNQRPN